MTLDRLMLTTSEIAFLAAVAASILTIKLVTNHLAKKRKRQLDLDIEKAKAQALVLARTWVVLVDDNFHFMDEDERYVLGTYPNYLSAENACKALLRRELRGIHADKPEASAGELYGEWLSFGESPFIEGGAFIASGYVREEANRLTRFKRFGL